MIHRHGLNDTRRIIKRKLLLQGHRLRGWEWHEQRRGDRAEHEAIVHPVVMDGRYMTSHIKLKLIT